MNTKSTRSVAWTKKGSATKSRYFRTFLLMQQFAPEEIGGRIAQARREADGMTQETLAEALDLSVRQLQNIEAGSSIPWRHFSRLEAIFGRSLGWFLHGQDDDAKDVAEAISAVEARLESLEDAVATGFERALVAIAALADGLEDLGRRVPPEASERSPKRLRSSG